MSKTMWDRIAKPSHLLNGNGNGIYKAIIDTIKKSVSYEDDVLEIAAGTGTIAVSIAPFVHHIEGSDLSEQMVCEARKNAERHGVSHVNFSVQDARHLQYASESFDVVIIAFALQVIMDADEALREAARVLKPGGILIAPTRVAGSGRLSNFYLNIFRIIGYKDYYSWTGREFIDFLEDHGFYVVKAKGYHGMVPVQYIEAKNLNGLENIKVENNPSQEPDEEDRPNIKDWIEDTYGVMHED